MAQTSTKTTPTKIPSGYAEQYLNLRDLERKWQLSDSKRGYLKEVLEAYEGDQISLQRRNSAESKAHFVNKPKFACNALARIVDEKAFLYDSEPIRRFPEAEDSDEEAEAWGELMWNYGGPGVYNAHMDELDPVVWLHGAVATWVDWVEEPDIGAGVEWTLIPRHRFEVLGSRRDPEKPRAVIAAWSTDVEGDELVTWLRYADETYEAWVRVGAGDGKWEFWEDDRDQMFVPHSLGEVPITVARNRVGKHGTFDGPRLGGPDLLENTRTLGHILTEGATATRLARGQMWVAGRFHKDEKPVISPEVVWRIEKNGTAGGIASGANLAGIESMFQLFLEAYALTAGVSPDVVRLKQTVVESGKAILVRRAAKTRIAQRRRRQGQAWEYDKHRLGSKVIKLHDGRTLDFHVLIEYPQGVPVLTVEDRLKMAEFAQSARLLPAEKVLAFLFDELPPEEIRRLLAAAQAEQPEPVETPPTPPGADPMVSDPSTDPAEEYDDRTGAQ